MQNLTVSLSYRAISGGGGSRLLHDPGSTTRVDLMFCDLPRHRELVCSFKAQLDFAGSKKSVRAAGAIFFTMPMESPFFSNLAVSIRYNSIWGYLVASGRGLW